MPTVMKNRGLILVLCAGFFCSANTINLEVGDTIDLLKSFGFFGQVWNSNQNYSQNLEITRNIFNRSRLLDYVIIKNDVMRGNWQVEVCSNWTHLMNILFRDYNIEMVEELPKAFMANWSQQNWATFLGLSELYLTGRFTYLLVKFEQHSKFGRISEFRRTEIEPSVEEQIKRLRADDERSILRFIAHSGSHYVSSYTYGDAIFQIFVYDNKTGEEFKKKRRLNDEKKFRYEMQKYGYAFASKIGEIRTLSGDRYLESLLSDEAINGAACSLSKPKKNLITLMYNNCQTSFKDNYRLAQVPIQFKLESIANIIPNRSNAIQLEEFIDNQIKLRELYL